MPAPVNRTALFDPGAMSKDALDIQALEFLDDIIITHIHPDHFDLDTIKALVAKFPDARITGPTEVVKALADAGITATDQPSEGIEFFNAPHENVVPMFPQPQQDGVHYLDLLTNPGDSHSFTETKAVLALPITAPWGATITALNLALKLKPQYVLPIHDWHWSDQARTGTYNDLEKLLKEQGTTFCKLETGQPVVLDI